MNQLKPLSKKIPSKSKPLKSKKKRKTKSKKKRKESKISWKMKKNNKLTSKNNKMKSYSRKLQNLTKTQKKSHLKNKTLMRQKKVGQYLCEMAKGQTRRSMSILMRRRILSRNFRNCSWLTSQLNNNNRTKRKRERVKY